MAMTTLHRFTEPEYFELESTGDERHEFVDGEVFVMPGANYLHGRIGGNLVFAVEGRLRGGSCGTITSEVRIKVDSAGRYLYPDLSVVCGQPQIQKDRGQQSLLNPIAVFEILSPSTEHRDRGVKLASYHQIDSLQAYVLIDQSAAIVERYQRSQQSMRSDGREWLYARYHGLEQEVELASLGIRVPLSEIYYHIDFESDPPS